jgi:hypothetical protein
VTYTLTVDQKPTYLHAVVTGDNSAQAVEQYMEELMRECTARGASRVLIEERLVGPRLGAFEVFSMVSKGTARYRQAVEALAFVDVNAEGNVMRFAEEVAVNRGFPVRVFPTVAAAEQWLLHGLAGARP